jgi:nucleoside-diphosphate-sugar epimerase
MLDVRAENQILIVGAGPSGLALAAELKRRGVDVAIVDQQPAGANTSRACVVHARTMEEWGRTEMDRRIAVVLYVVAMAALIVGVDFVFFRSRFWERLIVNIGIVLVFGAFYLRFLMPPWSQWTDRVVE